MKSKQKKGLLADIVDDIKDEVVHAVRQGVKYDAGKPPLGRLPRAALLEDAAVYDFGHHKYDWNNWRKGIAWHRQLDAALRHIYAFLDGEDLDPESGICHLAHARVDLAMVSEYRGTHPELDDRYKP